MSKEKRLEDLMDFLMEDEVAGEIVDTEIERSEESVKAELEKEKEIAQARKEFEEGGFSSGVYVTDEGIEDIAIYGKSSKGTPLNILMEMCEADLPYVDEETRQDYERYVEEFQIKFEPYDATQRNKKIDDLF